MGRIGVTNTSTTINRVITPNIEPNIERPGPVAGTNGPNQTTKPSYFWTIIAAGAVGGLLVLMVGGSVLALNWSYLP